MRFASGINRPPYETADGYLQTTEGCSHNRCLFCTYFKDRIFRRSTIEEIEADIKQIPMYFGAPKRIFLQGADGFAADWDVLMKTAELLHKYVPSAETIGGYARIDNFYDKTEQQLRDMTAVGFANPYIGVESGDDVVFKRINKGYTAAQARELRELQYVLPHTCPHVHFQTKRDKMKVRAINGEHRLGGPGGVTPKHPKKKCRVLYSAFFAITELYKHYKDILKISSTSAVVRVVNPTSLPFAPQAFFAISAKFLSSMPRSLRRL